MYSTPITQGFQWLDGAYAHSKNFTALWNPAWNIAFLEEFRIKSQSNLVLIMNIKF